MKNLLDNKFYSKIKQIWNNVFFRQVEVRLVLLAFLLNLLVEMFSRRSIGLGFQHMFTHPLVFIYNSLMILMTLSICLLFRRRVFTASVVCVVWLTCGITNFVILASRKTPFTAQDLSNIDEAMKVIPSYLSFFQIVLIVVGIIAVIVLLVIWWFRAPKVQAKVRYIRSIITVALIILLFTGTTKLFIYTGVLGDYFGNIGNAYKDYGFGYCFANTMFNSGIDKPDDYSEEKVNEVIDSVETSVDDAVNKVEDYVPKSEDDYPNIIFVQLESLFDPTLLEGVTFSEDPLPNLHRLYKQYSSGYLNVPCFGAGTANTEFEMISGFNLDDFGPGEYPYKTVLKESTCESICYYLKKYGYSTNAIHNNDATFYRRNSVFGQLGFDTFTPLEYMNNVETTETGWAKDNCLTKQITGVLDSTKGKDFIYTISVQGHGDYPESIDQDDYPIKVEGDLIDSYKDGFTYYVNQIHEMDQFVADLINAVDKRKENTIIVFYGDHMPAIDVTEDDVKNGNLYQTEYVIWDNFGMHKEDRDIEAFQMSTYVMSKVGLKGGVISNCHLVYLDDKTQTEEDRKEYLTNLKLLEYDILYGDVTSYNGVLPFTRTNIQMGFRQISVEKAYNMDSGFAVCGQNFTKYSKVRLNGQFVDTEFVNASRLNVEDHELSPADNLAIVQLDDDDVELSSTSIYVFSGKETKD